MSFQHFEHAKDLSNKLTAQFGEWWHVYHRSCIPKTVENMKIHLTEYNDNDVNDSYHADKQGTVRLALIFAELMRYQGKNLRLLIIRPGNPTTSWYTNNMTPWSLELDTNSGNILKFIKVDNIAYTVEMPILYKFQEAWHAKLSDLAKPMLKLGLN